MICRYCQTWNDSDDHRCRRCGRRMPVADARPDPYRTPITTSALPVWDAGDEPEVRPEARPEPRPMVARQVDLFPEERKVIQLPGTPVPSPLAIPSTPSRSGGRHTARRTVPGQGTFDFTPARVLQTSVEASIRCETRPASPLERLAATATDAFLIALSLAMFLGPYLMLGGEVTFTRYTAAIWIVGAGLVALFYRTLWCLAGVDTPGMRAMHLRLVNFDGLEPDERQRTLRLAGAVLSLCAAGIGFFWAVFDEESLTWHDHISKTFPARR